MKKIVSMLLAIMMIIGMLPMGILSASAAEVSETMTITATSGTVSGKSISWTSGNLTFTANQNTSSTAIRTSDSDHFRLYVGFSATLTCSAGNITKIVMTATGSSYAIAPTGSDGSVGTVSGTTITIVPTAVSNTYTISSITKQTRIKSIEVTYADVSATDCTHENTEAIAAKEPTCLLDGNTAGVKCVDCGATVSGNETIAATGHTEDAGVVTAPTCTEDGYTTYTCSVCDNTRKGDWVDATGHNYVDGTCSYCGLEKPTGLDGKYYIAAIRSSGNYWYMTNDLGTASTQRYQIVDSGLTELPASIETPVDAQVFELVEVDGGYMIKTGDQYLGWTSGNSGSLVAEDAAIVATIEYGETEGSYNIHFTETDGERYLALNSNSQNNYYAWYKPGQAQDLFLIPVIDKSEGCTHANTEVIEAKDPACTESGNTAGVKCVDCDTVLEGNETIDALGHNFVNGTCDREGCGEIEVVTPTEGSINFATTDQRVSLDTSSQVWSDGTLTVTNNKASSSTNVADYSNPIRFYKSSEIVIAFPGMTKIVVVCDNDSYATALKNSVTGATVTVDGVNVTIELTEAADSFTITLTGGQVRVDSITVKASKICNHVWGEPEQTVAPTCALEGTQVSTCTLCSETKPEPVAALGHVVADGVCTVCNGEIYTNATTLKNNDNVVIFNPYNKVAMSSEANDTKLAAVATNDVNGFAVLDPMAVLQVNYINETDFYLLNNGKYLTSGATGNSLSFKDEADDYSIWYLEVPFEGEDVVVLHNRNAAFNGTAQSMEYYNDAFTTYSKGTGYAYQMKLYVKAGADPVAAIGDTEYASFEAAYAAAAEGQYIKLLDDVYLDELTLQLTKDLYIDLNGKSIEGEITVGECKIYAIDSATADYTSEGGYLGLTVDGALVEAQTVGNYLMIEGDNGWTFNAYAVELTHVSLDATNDALGYKAQVKGNAVVMENITGFGFKMGVQLQKTYELNGQPTDGIFTLRLKGIMAAGGGEMDVTSSAFVILNGETVETATHSTTMKETILAVNELTALSDAQKTAVYNLYAQYSEVMDAWFTAEGKTNNIIGWAPVTTEE